MTIPGTVDKTSSATGRSNNNSKSPSKAVQIKKPGITIKRKPSTPVAGKSPSAIPAKKNKKSSSSSSGSGSSNSNKTVKSTAAPSPVASFDLEVTLCPICDEACTCPKTTNTSSIVVKSPNSNNNNNKKTLTENISKKPVNKKKNNNKKDKPKYVKKTEITSEDDESEGYYEEESEGEDTTPAVVEDPALSFIRMIYSDEESLDEEEAYALYQATQLFSSSSDEEVEYFEDQSDCEESYDEDDDDEDEEESDDNDFEYTVVEYVQPSKKQVKKSTEFVAYGSGDETESDDETGDQVNLLLNAEGPTGASDSEISSTESSEDENWLTYSVFDVDRDLALNHLTGSSSCTSLSSHGSGTPDTLLFSTSSTDKIPNIAPQVLAAISAAAKHMANQRSDSSNSTISSKYFSYITLRDPLKTTTSEEVNEEEFLFFEEAAVCDSDEQEEDCSSISDVISDEDLEDISVEDSDEFESFSDCSSNESVTEIILPSNKKIMKAPTIQQQPPVLPTPATAEYNINRWNRVPIGAFRRSRRPSIPAYHHIHPSNALKTFSTDPANFTLSTSSTTTAAGGEDSFDESSVAPMERAYSVVSWNELDLDITPGNNNTVNTPPTCPLPKRSRSVMLPSTSSNSLVNNFEWLNNNWNWEI